jgi:hypothetical protein
MEDIIGRKPKIGDFIVFQRAYEIKLDKIIEIRNNHIRTLKKCSVNNENFLIINEVVDKNPQYFI